MFELKMITDLSVLPKIVETNIDEIAPIIAEKIAKIDGLVVDEAGLAQAKTDAAELRKISKAVATFRKDHLSIWKAPMESFEAKCKDYEKRLDAAADDLGAKVNAIVDQRKAEKRERMRALVQKALGEKFPDPKQAAFRDSPFWASWFGTWTDTKQKGCWLNATIADEFAYNQALQECDRVLEDFAAVRDTYCQEDHETKKKAFLVFCRAFDLKETLSTMRAWRIEREALAAARAADEAQKAANPPASAPAEVAAPVAPVAPAETPAPAEAPAAPVRSWTVTITGTFEAVKDVTIYARAHGVEIKPVQTAK